MEELTTTLIDDEDSRPVEELVAQMSGTELYVISNESSNVYNGIVLAKAIEIIVKQFRFRFTEISAALSVSRQTYYRLAAGADPVRDNKFNQYMERLALIRAKIV